MSCLRLLIVDDEKHARDGLALALGKRYAVRTASNGTEAMAMLQSSKEPFHLVLTDLRMPGPSGMDVICFCQTLHSPPACILMTAYGDIPTAVGAMKAGAVDFLSKPLDLNVVEVTIEQALRQKQIFPTALFPPTIVGQSAAMQHVLGLVRRVAPTNATVLLVGETGVGKELFAREVHRLSARANGPFLALNGAALPEEMIESQLFGYERGAFTDARQRHCGYFERAHGGTLLLDEIGELPLYVQIKLLRALETKSFERLGGDSTLQVDVRLIAATNASLEMRVRSGDFREDLFYRINVIQIHIPPLRERLDDLELLMESFWSQWHCPPRLNTGAMELLRRHTWPGNVRELRNFCDAMAVLYPAEFVNNEQIESYFSRAIVSQIHQSIPLPDKRIELSSDAPRNALPEMNIQRVLTQCNGNHSRAAKILGISRSTLYRRLKDEKECEEN